MCRLTNIVMKRKVTFKYISEMTSGVYLFWNDDVEKLKVGLIGQTDESCNTLLNRMKQEEKSEWIDPGTTRCIAFIKTTNSTQTKNLESRIISAFSKRFVWTSNRRETFKLKGKQSLRDAISYIEDFVDERSTLYIVTDAESIECNNDEEAIILDCDDNKFPSTGTWLYNGSTPFILNIDDEGNFIYENEKYKWTNLTKKLRSVGIKISRKDIAYQKFTRNGKDK